MRTYKAEPRNSAGWQAYDACTLGISISSPNWHGAKFAAIMDFAAKHFKHIRIDVTDALYRHTNMAAGMTPDQALNAANAEGALWLAGVQDIIDACPVPVQVVRWAEWYQHQDYQTVLDGFKAAHATSHVLREAVVADIAAFYGRKGNPPSLREQQASLDYLLEELAVMTLQARKLSSAKLYPGDELECLRVVRAGLVPEAPKGLEREHFVRIKFRGRNLRTDAKLRSG